MSASCEQSKVQLHSLGWMDVDQKNKSTKNAPPPRRAAAGPHGVGPGPRDAARKTFLCTRHTCRKQKIAVSLHTHIHTRAHRSQRSALYNARSPSRAGCRALQLSSALQRSTSSALSRYSALGRISFPQKNRRAPGDGNPVASIWSCKVRWRPPLRALYRQDLQASYSAAIECMWYAVD